MNNLQLAVIRNLNCALFEYFLITILSDGITCKCHLQLCMLSISNFCWANKLDSIKKCKRWVEKKNVQWGFSCEIPYSMRCKSASDKCDFVEKSTEIRDPIAFNAILSHRQHFDRFVRSFHWKNMLCKYCLS